MIWFNFVSKLISILHSGDDPRQIAGGFAFGALIGLTPLYTLQNLLIFCVMLLLNVSVSAAFFGILVFSGFAYIFDPQFHDIGYYILVKVDALRPFWIQLYNMPIAPYTRFNNTVTMGSLATGIVLFWPVYFGFKHFVLLYQRHMAERVNKLKVMQIIQGSNIIQWYNRVKLK